MKTTTVSTSELLEKLQENRVKHITEYKKARKTWLKKAIKELRKVANKAEKSKSLNSKSFMPLAELPKPISYAKLRHDDRSSQSRGERPGGLDDRIPSSG